ncbi:MAG TPA: serine hydrolase domain-containing protein, partial [Acidimicrobiia bacterium]|nr:serine hydrolase domain-containing protein [Acidimicrobiia bacterium]
MSIDRLLESAEKLVSTGATPACQVAVAREGELLAFETFGAATNDTRFCMFSATKPIVASAMWLLIGDGLLDVERPVAHYVPEFATHGKERVTVEQVLLHTAGFPNAVLDSVEGADPVTRVKRFTEWELEWEPGTRFEYHPTSAHWVLAELLERLCGEDFRDMIERRICEPLGLPRLLGIPREEQADIIEGVRLGNEIPALGANTLRFNEPAVREAGVPGGGAFATAATVAKFYQALLRNPNGLWNDDVLRDAKTNIRCTLPEPLLNVDVNRTIGLVIAGD